MTKEHIISEIIRTAKENKGRPLGRMRFEKETGIKWTDWYGKYWTKWNDAVEEAGYRPNIMQSSYDEEFLIRKVIDLIQEIGRFPTYGDLRLKAHKDNSFPSHNTFRKLGYKHEFARKIYEYCKKNDELSAIADICLPLCEALPVESKFEDEEAEGDFGFVYLLKMGRHYKIGRSICAEKRAYELKLQLPEKAKLIHKIKTDDPVGIEKYWHNRFAEKQAHGEWFKLTALDVRAFRRRRFQ